MNTHWIFPIHCEKQPWLCQSQDDMTFQLRNHALLRELRTALQLSIASRAARGIDVWKMLWKNLDLLNWVTDSWFMTFHGSWLQKKWRDPIHGAFLVALILNICYPASELNDFEPAKGGLPIVGPKSSTPRWKRQVSVGSSSFWASWWFQPLWKIWVRQLGRFFPIYGKIIQMFQTTNQWGMSRGWNLIAIAKCCFSKCMAHDSNFRPRLIFWKRGRWGQCLSVVTRPIKKQQPFLSNQSWMGPLKQLVCVYAYAHTQIDR